LIALADIVLEHRNAPISFTTMVFLGSSRLNNPLLQIAPLLRSGSQLWRDLKLFAMPRLDACYRHAQTRTFPTRNAAYRHFLFGNGKDRFIDYERFISGDPVGARLITKLLSDFKQHVGIISKDRVSFSVVSEPYSIGAGGFVGYPETANWQKALGGHVVWVDANVSVIVNEKHQMEHRAAIMIHMEDRYNFNPGQHDVATGIPDSANGRFELTGLAKQYTNRGKIVRHIVWSEGAPGEGSASGAPEGRGRRPADNRRLRNRL
jgi:hypothetical protein